MKSAFPFSVCRTPEGIPYSSGDIEPGMSLRDWFAGQALANIWLQSHVSKPGATALAATAYKIADAMLAAREEGVEA